MSHNPLCPHLAQMMMNQMMTNSLLCPSLRIPTSLPLLLPTRECQSFNLAINASSVISHPLLLKYTKISTIRPLTKLMPRPRAAA